MDIVWVQYKNQKLGVAVSHPKHWVAQQPKPNMAVFSGPPEQMDVRPQISYQRAEPESTSDAWFQETIQSSEAQQRATYIDYNLLRSEELPLAGVRGFWRLSEWRYENTDIYGVNMQALIWPKANTIYVVKAATLKTLAERDVPIFEQMIKTTKLL